MYYLHVKWIVSENNYEIPASRKLPIVLDKA
jgi:hypothetical protein